MLSCFTHHLFRKNLLSCSREFFLAESHAGGCCLCFAPPPQFLLYSLLLKTFFVQETDWGNKNMFEERFERLVGQRRQKTESAMPLQANAANNTIFVFLLLTSYIRTGKKKRNLEAKFIYSGDARAGRNNRLSYLVFVGSYVALLAPA